jgi:hypothetical protein
MGRELRLGWIQQPSSGDGPTAIRHTGAIGLGINPKRGPTP